MVFFDGIFGLSSALLEAVLANFAGDCADFGGFGPSKCMYFCFGRSVRNSIG